MGHESDLLRMLEPVVRPDGVSGVSGASGVGHRARGQGHDQPIETRSFESILEQANQMAIEEQDDPTQPDKEPFLSRDTAMSNDTNPSSPPRDAFNPLSGIDRIENSSLRDLISQHGETTNKKTSP